MYNGYGTYTSPPPELSNNPFIEQSSVNRFPDINAISSQSSTQYTSWPQQQQLADGVGIPQGYGYNPQLQPQQQQYTGWNPSLPNQQPQSIGRQQFQPSSSFGQQLSTHMNGGGSGYVSPGGDVGMQQLQQATGYPQQLYSQAGYQQQPTGYQSYGGGIGMQQQATANYLSEFDPYAPISQGWEASTQYQQQPRSSPGTQSIPSAQEHLHPREFVRKYKRELEIWDVYTWKQMQNAFDALKESWAKRMQDVEGRIRQLSTNQWGIASPQELAHGQQLLKDAESKFSSTAASSFQMKEVLQGYRHSVDTASKRRVREAMNAALQSLPDWPSLNY